MHCLRGDACVFLVLFCVLSALYSVVHSYLRILSTLVSTIVFYRVQSSQLAARIIVNDLLTYLLIGISVKF